jgi:hypothetical protein
MSEAAMMADVRAVDFLGLGIERNWLVTAALQG